MSRRRRGVARRRAAPIADVAIVGGGIIGCAVARELASAGARVTLFERGEPGREASSAAAGMLGPQAECDAAGPLLTLGVASRALYPETVAALREETGIDAELDRDGIVYVALDAAEEAVLLRRARWQRRAGYRVEQLGAADVRALEPAIAAEVRSGLRFPDDYRVDNVRLMRAYAVAAACAGVTIVAGTPVFGVHLEGGRAVAVDTAAGRVAAASVVDAAGAWAAQLVRAAAVGVRPVRGQMALLAARRPPFRHAVYWHRVYLVPRRDGRVLAGSTYEDAGFDKRVTAAALEGILARAFRIAPSLADASFVEAWAGLRPGTPDGLPVIGADPAIGGLFHATGHYRNGILLAPITARIVRELILERTSSHELSAFAPGRFGRRDTEPVQHDAAASEGTRSRGVAGGARVRRRLSGPASPASRARRPPPSSPA